MTASHHLHRILFAVSLVVLNLPNAPAAERPNVLWLTAEDHGPQVGCYGDAFATTPNLDALAARGMIYERVWSVVPVCAPARTTLITGLYPSSTGAEHMRSLVRLPEGFALFPQLLRAAGYYCSNNAKEDYNVEQPGQAWDESSGKAHWRKRAAGQPFFAVFNDNRSHESQVRKRPHRRVHDPAGVRVPAYHPDLPEVREDWAQYYDQLSVVDAGAGERLAELAADGLAEDTIVFYFADHGPGMPRCKRSACDSGLRVPLIVYFPEKWRQLAPSDYRPGGKSERLVSFVDMAPTVLSLAGVEPPSWLQGVAFAGQHAGPAPNVLHGLRGRMDERYDTVRSVTDGRFVYVRNYRPELPAGQHVAYMFETPTTRVWKRAFDEGRLNAAQGRFWQPRAGEELYDLQTDPDEVENLAARPEHAATLARLREAQRAQVLAVRDVGLLPEAEMHRRAGGDAPWTFGHDEKRYPVERVLAAAELASSCGAEGTVRLRELLSDDDSGVRYWGATGLRRLGPEATAASDRELRRALADESPSVRIAAAEALGDAATLEATLKEQGDNLYLVIAAINAAQRLGLSERELPSLATLRPARRTWEPRAREAVGKLLRISGRP